MTRLLAVVLMAACVPPDDGTPEATTRPPADADDLPTFAAAIPDAEIPDLDLEMALTLAAMPLSCLDRPHAAPRDRRTYLDTLVASRVPGYEDSRAFYGCWDWHSAVNSTWAMVRLYKEFPNIPVSGLIQEKLNDHLSEEALEGEVAFFEESRSFERPYGWAWLLRLHAELSTWDHENAGEWAAHVEPLATIFSERMVEYLEDLKVPSRSGTHSNTAFSLAIMLESARVTRDMALETAIEDAAELQLKQDHVVRLESRPANIEGKGAVSIRDLVKNSLRMRPDRIIVGEVRDASALDMLQAMNTGHDGSICTLHSNGPRDTLSRMETMVLMAGMDLPVRAIREQVASAVDLIVHQTRFKDGTRRITHITEVERMEGDVITLQDIFVFDGSAGFDRDGRSLGRLRATGLRPKFLEKMAYANVTVDPLIFATDRI